MSVHTNTVRLHAHVSLVSLAFPSLVGDEITHKFPLFAGSMDCMPLAIAIIRVDALCLKRRIPSTEQKIPDPMAINGLLVHPCSQNWSQTAQGVYRSEARVRSDKIRMVCPIGIA